MPDPITLVVLGGAAGGAASELVKKGIESGQLWLRQYFADHEEKVAEKAAANANDYLNRLAEKVYKLEEEHSIDRAVIDSVLEDPSYSLLLQKSLIASAETPSQTKHEVMARLVSERLRHEEEDIYSLCAPLAIEAIGRCTHEHLKMLALLAYMFGITHRAGFPEEARARLFFEATSPFLDITVTELDILHLESISCISFDANAIYHAFQLVDRKFGGEEKIWDVLSKYGDVNPFHRAWGQHLSHSHPTSVGQIIGYTVFDEKRGRRTDLSKWGRK